MVDSFGYLAKPIQYLKYKNKIKFKKKGKKIKSRKKKFSESMRQKSDI